ncbi:MAG: PAS domain-containing protein, partial [Armatimonadetes bacterium]|nr:PAS domain-containing protein [Armatimonadota bacterium]
MSSLQPPALVLAATAVIAWVLAAYAWSGYRHAGRNSFAVTMLATGWWAASTAAEWLSPAPQAKLAWSVWSYLGIATAPSAWIAFVDAYTGGNLLVTRRRRLALWVVPAAMVVLAFTNRWHGLIWYRVTTASELPGAPLVYHHGGAFWAFVGYSYSALLYTSVRLTAKAMTSPMLYRWQIALMLVGVALPWIASVLYLVGPNPLPGLDLTPLGFTATGLAMAIGVLRFRVLDLAPVAHDVVFAQLSDAVVVLDRRERIADLNAAAQQLLGTSAVCTGLPLLIAAARHPELARRLEAGLPPSGELRLGEAFYDLKVVDLTTRRGRLSGHLLVFRDLTDRHAAEESLLALERQRQATQRLEAMVGLAAGVAHDYNNILTAIMGNTELAIDLLPAESEGRPLLDSVMESARRAAQLTHQMLVYSGHGRTVTADVALAALVTRSLQPLGANLPEGVRVELRLPSDLPPVPADPGQLGFLVEALLLNAIEAVEPSGGEVVVAARVRRYERPRPARLPELVDLPAGDYLELEISDTGRG